MKILKSLLLTIAITLPMSAFAAPSNKSLNEFSKIANYEAFFLDTITAPLEEYHAALSYELINNEKLSDDDRKKAMEIFGEYATGLVNLINTKANKEHLKKAYIDAAKSTYTQAEIDAQLAYYGSQAGKSAEEKTPKVLGDYLQNTKANVGKQIEEYHKTNAILMQDKIKQIIKD